MRVDEYARLYQAEETLWWFRAMHLFIKTVLPKRWEIKNPLALDIGCGTGGLIHVLSLAGFHSIGLDYSKIALTYAAKRTSQLIQANANFLPFDSVFDLIVSIDVLEIDNIEPSQFVDTALASLKHGGYGLFVMAAHQWLMSEHDRAVNSVRRFNISQMKNLFCRPGIQIVRSSYLFFLLFPLIAARKLSNRKHHVNRLSPQSDVSLMPRVIDRILYAICLLESKILSVFNFPMGSSALVIIRKE